MFNIPKDFFEEIRVRFNSPDDSIDEDLIIDESNGGQSQTNADNQGSMLGKKHERENERNANNISNKENSLTINSKIIKVSENNVDPAEKKLKKSIEPTKNKFSTDDETHEAHNIERKKDKDNFSIKLFKDLNDWFLEYANLNNEKRKIKPNYYIFTHNTNSVDIYVFLDISYENILYMTPKIKEALDQLLVDLKIKKIQKKKETPITEKSKEYKDVIKLLSINDYIKRDEKYSIEEINYFTIKYLKDNGYKNSNEDVLYKKDKDKIIQILIEQNLKKTRDNQQNNKNDLNNKNIEHINKTLRELIKQFYQSQNFEKFKQKVKDIDENFKKKKKYKYSLLDKKEYVGFIKMVEEDCNLNNEQKKKIKDFTDYFRYNELNEEEIQKYREKIV